MMRPHLLIFLISIAPMVVSAQDPVRARMEQAAKTASGFKSLMREPGVVPFWSESPAPLCYRTHDGAGGHRFLSVDPKTGTVTPAFDHDALAKTLSARIGKPVAANRLPLDFLTADPARQVVRFFSDGKSWMFHVNDHTLSPDKLPRPTPKLLPPDVALKGTRKNGPAADITISNKTPGTIGIHWIDGRGKRTSYGQVKQDGETTLSSYTGHVWLFTDANGKPLAGAEVSPNSGPVVVTGELPPSAPDRNNRDTSPDGKWRALIRDHNLSIVPAGGGDPVFRTRDGTPADHWDGPVEWSPDSRKIAAFRTREVDVRKVHIVRSSPTDTLQPQLLSINYPKPGDPIRQSKPHLIDVGKRAEIPVKDALFSNPWAIHHGQWTSDSAEFMFLYNQRGHQVMRIVALDAESGNARTILEETSGTFIDYSQKTYLHHLTETREILWASERDGRNHLYLLDAANGRIKNPVTRGDGNFREMIKLDTKSRTAVVKINGAAGQDPYHDHFARVPLDGGSPTPLTDGDGTHGIEFSPDGKYLLVTWSRVDHPPVVELRDATTGKKIAELARGDDSAMAGAGWSRPERFSAKGRDGKTDIFGVIYRPSRFDPARKYPVLEDIYAGPHDFFTPKAFSPWSGFQQMAELGFIVVKIDGMGTNWRSKAFHDVCWKNLKDSGFPDRIAWIRAAAATRPWMDLDRVGIYGGSAGGQSTVAGLLHHGDFYKAGVADCGCHDNRMDKIWWNEAWMGWPVDDSYRENSNVTHAAKLTGKLLLVVGEVDENVDPASTAQVAAALQKAGIFFEYLPIMNTGHGAAESAYGSYRRAEFLIRHLQKAGRD